MSKLLRTRAAGAWLVAAALVVGSVALAKTPKKPKKVKKTPAAASAKASASAPAASGSAAASASARAPLPGRMPHGHPTTGSASPHGGGGSKLNLPPKSMAAPDIKLPPGTLVAEVYNAKSEPMAGLPITIGIVKNKVATGEKHEHLAKAADGEGRARWDKLSRESTTAYRVSVTKDGVTYAAMPFRLPTTSGMRAKVYVFPVSKNIKDATIAIQGVLFVELKDHVFQVEQAYTIYNLSSTTWLPENLQLQLPPGAKAIRGQKSMSGVMFIGKEGGRVALTGGIKPGKTQTHFRYQIPRPNDHEVSLKVGVLPHIQAFRVISDAAPGMALRVQGFPDAIKRFNDNGQALLLTDKRFPGLDPTFTALQVRFENMPTTDMNARAVVVVLAAGLIAAFGIYSVQNGKRIRRAGMSPKERRRLQNRTLDALDALETALVEGEVGPKTYEREKRALLAVLARLMTEADQLEPKADLGATRQQRAPNGGPTASKMPCEKLWGNPPCKPVGYLRTARGKAIEAQFSSVLPPVSTGVFPHGT